MNILTDTSGEFHFLDKDYNDVIFTDWNDIPEDFEFSHVIKFLPNIPPAPHTPEQHLEVGQWNARLTKLMEIERAGQ
ncbi:hypothetical protein [Synechococcus phage MA10]